MKKFSSTFNPIIEDPDYYIYQKMVESCCNYIEEIEKSLEFPEQIRSIVAFMAKSVYDKGFTDGLIVDDVCEKEPIIN